VLAPIAPRVVWIDAQLPPALAHWIDAEYGLSAVHVQDLGLLRAGDAEIFERARAQGAVVVTKDIDFVHLLQRQGPPPQVVWITAGNLTKARLRELVTAHWANTLDLLDRGEPLVEIQG
jgi:predicted nuclease of predicted toxin-antitoxin system